MRTEEHCLLRCKSQIEEVAQKMGSDLVGLHIKGVLAGKFTTISRKQLVLKGAVPPGLAMSPNVKPS